MDITLEWSRPISFPELFSGSKELEKYMTKGMYLWTDVDEKFNYIGRALGTPNLVTRQRDHYFSVIGGRSIIPSRYRNAGHEWSIVNSKDFPEVILDRDKFKELVDSAFDYLSDIRVRLCPLPNLDRGQISDIEKYLIFRHKPWCNSVGVDRKPDVKISLRMTGDWPRR